MKKWVVCLVIGLGMLAFSTGAGINDNTIRCGSEIMGPGDVCEETRAGSVTDTETYEEMKEGKEAAQRTFNSWGRWALLGGGLLLTGLGIWGIVKVKRQRKAGNMPGQAGPREPGQQFMQGPPAMRPGPQPNYGPPQQNYAPPPGYSPQAPHPNYGPPQQNYAPPPGYSPQAPHPNYGPPPQQDNYPPPQQPFGPGSQ